MLALEDGIWSGHLDFADVLFLIAVVVFAVGFVATLRIKPLDVFRATVALGLALVSLALLVL